MRIFSFTAGETILNQGETGDSGFVVVSGTVEVSVGSGKAPKTLATLSAGDVFGEMSLIDPSPRSATVRALTDVVCEVTSYEEFMSGRSVELGSTVIFAANARAPPPPT